MVLFSAVVLSRGTIELSDDYIYNDKRSWYRYAVAPISLISLANVKLALH